MKSCPENDILVEVETEMAEYAFPVHSKNEWYAKGLGGKSR